MPPIRAIARGKRLSPDTPRFPNRKDGFTTNTAPAIAVRMHAHWKPSAASLRIIIEVIGRLPVVATLDSLDEDILIEILTKPKNALVKQFEYLLSLDDVKLSFDDEKKIIPEKLKSKCKKYKINYYKINILMKI